MASEQQWEFCQLMLVDWQEEKGQWYYDVAIRYFSEKGAQYRNISDSEGKNAKPWSYNPYDFAFGFLGTAGWELVSVQHSLATGGTPSTGTGSGLLRWSNTVAYFKRPRVQGRNVNEPNLIFPQNPYG